jgi:hypothetical protein
MDRTVEKDLRMVFPFEMSQSCHGRSAFAIWHESRYAIVCCRTTERMQRASTVFLLLLAMFLGLSSGPHPCHATKAPSPVKAVAEHGSCHGQPAPQAPVRQGHDCCDPLKGGHALCDQACQGPAMLGIAPLLPVLHSMEELAAILQDRPASLFVPSIDHVPLG